MKRDLPCGHVVAVIDFAQNYAHEPRFEHQSNFFSQTQTTILPIVLRFRIEDLTNIDETRRAELIAFCDKHELPHVITETHYVISSDMQHDSAFVQKAFDDHIFPYIKSVTHGITTVCVRSDGCKAQFKCTTHFNWISRQSTEGCGLVVCWSFFESCHGKCDCDPEGGALKMAARRLELTAQEHKLKTSEDLYKWAKDESGLVTPVRSFEQKLGRGIYRRFFYWIPAKGLGAVDRASLPKYVSAKGTSRLHEFCDIGVPGTVQTRRGACHQCGACWKGDRRACENKDYVGSPQELQLRREAVPVTSLSRVTRPQLERAALERAASASLDSSICIETPAKEQTYPWVLGKVVKVSHKPSAAELACDSALREKSKINEKMLLYEPRTNQPALQVQLWEPLQQGSSTFTLSNIKVLIPAHCVRVISVDLTAIPRPPAPSPPTRELARRRASANVPGSTAGQAAPAPAAPPPPVRFKLADEGRMLEKGTPQEHTTNGLHEIRAEMPTLDELWEVEAVVQYRSYYRKGQWLVKWKNYDEARNTWEPWENLLLDCCLEAKEQGRECSVVHEHQVEAKKLEADAKNAGP